MPVQRRWRSGKDSRAPEDAGSMMTALSVEMGTEHVENAPRKKFVPEQSQRTSLSWRKKI